MQRRLDETQASPGSRRSESPATDLASRRPSFVGGAAVARPAHLGVVLAQLQLTHGNRHVQQLIAGMRERLGPVVQPKLVLGTPDDRHEREADRIARELAGPAAQQSVSADDARVARPPPIQRLEDARGGAVTDGLRHAIGQELAGGRPVPAELRGSLERGFDADFSSVRLHIDDRANDLNHALGARAFTVGRDIFFRRGDYNPDSRAGRQLLAHELTHVVQQGGDTPGSHSLQRQVIQRELTDEARKLLEDANKNEPLFTLSKWGDAVDLLEDSTSIRAEHIRTIMALPTGAPVALERFVQACLLRYFASSFASLSARGSNLSAEQVVRTIMADISTIKASLVVAGYGSGAITPELHSMLLASFGGSLNLGYHGLQAPSVDPRKLEVCATFVPGRRADYLRRAHSFIIYTDSKGISRFISAHADEKGKLHTENGLWSPTVFSDPKFVRKVIARGDEAEFAFPTMLRAAQRIDNESLKYVMISQNCNTATHYILKSAGYGDIGGPTLMTGGFGWSSPIEELEKPLRKRGEPAPRLIRSATTTAAAQANVASTATTSTTITSTVTSATTSSPTPGTRAISPVTASSTSTTGLLPRPAPSAPPTATATTMTTTTGTSQPPSISGPSRVSPGTKSTAAEDVKILIIPLMLNGAAIPAGSGIVVLKEYEKSKDVLIKVHPNGRTGHVNSDDLDRALGFS